MESASSPKPGSSKAQIVGDNGKDQSESRNALQTPTKALPKEKEINDDKTEDLDEEIIFSDDDEVEDIPKEGQLVITTHSPDCSTCGSQTAELTCDKEIEELLRSFDEPSNKYDWTTLAVRAGMTTFLFPTQMAQILMQVGYEPYSPRSSVTLLGRPCLLLPSTSKYLRYVYQVDGFSGIFHGLVPRISQQLIFTYVFDRTRSFFRRQHVKSVFARARAREIAGSSSSKEDNQSNVDDSEQSESIGAGFCDHFRDLIHELESKLTAIVVSYPLQVVVIRTVSQFVGRENCIREGLFNEIKAIYSDFGLFGFYRGLVPKLIGESCQTLAVGALAYFVSNQAPTQELRSLLNMSFSILVSAWTYQFSVVSTTMAVNGSCLKAGQPPIQPIYENWLQCWKDLKQLNVLNRGSSFICRYYTGPTRLANGMIQPYGVAFGPNHLATYKPSNIFNLGIILSLVLSSILKTN